MSKIERLYPNEGRQLFEYERPIVEEFNRKYNQPESHKTALQLIQESLPQEDAAKFHSNSREPFDYEQPVIDAAKDAMKGRSFYKHSDKPARLTVPFWLYENCEDVVKRTVEVESLIGRLRFVEQPLQVILTPTMFEWLYNHESTKQLYTYFTGASSPHREDMAPGKRWIKISKTLFVEELA